MPAATPRTAATRCSPPPTSRCGSAGSKREGLTVNPSRIEGGSPSNVVPDLAVLRVNMRPRTPEIEAERKARRSTGVVAARRGRAHDVKIEVQRRLRPPAQAADARGRGAVRAGQAGRRRPRPDHRLAAVGRGVRRQQYRRLRRARRRHDGRARRQDPQHGGVSDRREPGRARGLVGAHHPAAGGRRA